MAPTQYCPESGEPVYDTRAVDDAGRITCGDCGQPVETREERDGYRSYEYHRTPAQDLAATGGPA